MKVFIIEDERLGLDRLMKLLKEIDPSIDIIGYAETIKSAVWWLQNNQAPDIIFMDIELADGQCFEIFSQTQVNAPIIFTTSYDEYALQAFKVNGIDYLLKPIRKEDLIQSLKKHENLKFAFSRDMPIVQNIENLISGLQVIQQKREFRRRFLVKKGQKFLAIEVEEIAWFMADGKICFIKTWENNRYMVDYTLEQLGDLVDPSGFFRINRSFLVHFKSIVSVSPYFNGKLKLHLIPAPDIDDVVVSRERANEFKKWLGK